MSEGLVGYVSVTPEGKRVWDEAAAARVHAAGGSVYEAETAALSALVAHWRGEPPDEERPTAPVLMFPGGTAP